MAIVTKSVCLR